MNTLIISKRLKELRQKLNLTQREMAKDLDITAAALSKYESEIANPSINVLIAIAKKYNVSVDWLLGLSDDNSTTTEVINYSDILKPIITLTKSNKMLKITDLVHFLDDDEEWALIFCQNIGETDLKNNINSLLTQYLNILSLYASKTIDDNIFNAVIEKLEKDFDFEIKFDDEDLPW